MHLYREKLIFEEMRHMIYEKALIFEAAHYIRGDDNASNVRATSLSSVAMAYLDDYAPWLAADIRKKDRAAFEERLNNIKIDIPTPEELKGFARVKSK